MSHVCHSKSCSNCKGQNDRTDQRYCAKCHAGYMREWRKTHPLSADQRVKGNARSMANVYQRRGKLVQTPCLVCGAFNSEKHHEDYSRPLDVMWVCRPCHLDLHKRGRFDIIPHN